MINHRAESAKSNPYGNNVVMPQNINMSSAQPGEDGLLTQDQDSTQMNDQIAQQ